MPSRHGKQRCKNDGKNRRKQRKIPFVAAPVTHTKLDRKQLLLFGFMRDVQSEVKRIPTDVIKLCLLFYYIPFYSAVLSILGCKTFILKHCQFRASIAKCGLGSRRCEYMLNLSKFPAEFWRTGSKRRMADKHRNCTEMVLYHELTSHDGQVVDISVATFTADSRDFRATIDSSFLEPFTANTKVLRIGYGVDDASPYYVDFNPYDGMSVAMRAKWTIGHDDMGDRDVIFSRKFNANSWCLRYKRDKSVALVLLSLPAGIASIKVKCALKGFPMFSVVLSYASNTLVMKLPFQEAHVQIQEIEINAEFVGIQGHRGKINKRRWSQRGFKLGTKHFNLS